MLLGDFNPRTSNRDDFIANDIINDNILSEVSELLTYEMDEILPLRVNPDKVLNDYGSKLLSLCKSSGPRIFNGRHKNAMDRDYHGCERAKCCRLLYISSPDVFHITEQFIVSSFTVFSDQAPLHIQLKCASIATERPSAQSDLPTSRKVR